MGLYLDGKRMAPVIGVGNGGPIAIDDELSRESENPVQNKVITERIDNLEESIYNEMEMMGSEFDGNLADLTEYVNNRFEVMGSEFDGEIADLTNYVDNRFESLGSELDEQFDEIDQRLVKLDWDKVNKLDFLTALGVHTLWYGEEESSEEDPESKLNVHIVPTSIIGENEYKVEGRVLTIYSQVICKVGYEDVDDMVAIGAITNPDGSHSFEVPEGINDVYVVLKGDANLDGVITMEDADLMLMSVHNNNPEDDLKGLNFFAANINNNETITDSDAILISIIASRNNEIKW